MAAATLATMLKADAAGVARAAERLRSGGLVAFPTETVYGLGANALLEGAVLSIFAAKGRPLTDPLIVHVPDVAAGLELVELDGEARRAFEALAARFWPGPLTLVARAAAAIPSKVTADTGFVGIRCPNHPLALQLLRESRVPVAAPSANRFGHVSPTRAAHVMADLSHADVWVLDGDMARVESSDASAAATPALSSCNVGIESTVAKIDVGAGQCVIFRRGGVSELAIRAALDDADLRDLSINVVGKAAAARSDTPGLQAPGQMLTHYAPDLPTFLATAAAAEGAPGDAAAAADGGAGGGHDLHVAGAPVAPDALSQYVVLDFDGRMAWAKDVAAGYRDLSSAGDMAVAAAHVFDFLRWAESVQGAAAVLLVDPANVDHEHTEAVRDRLFRAASGKAVTVDADTGRVCAAGAAERADPASTASS